MYCNNQLHFRGNTSAILPVMGKYQIINKCKEDPRSYYMNNSSQLLYVHHNTVQQAHGLKEEDEDGATWCTRYVFIPVALCSGSSASRTEARLPFYLPNVFHSFAIYMSFIYS